MTAETMKRPLIKDAAGLSGLLQNVQPINHNGYQFTADPPCHQSDSGMGRAFHYGDAPGGGVRVGCWLPGCQGPGFVHRIEDRLGIRLQVNINGKLTYAGPDLVPGTIIPVYKSPLPPLPPPKPPDVAFKEIPAVGSDEPVTVGDWLAAPIWFVGAGLYGSSKHCATWKGQDGHIWTCRQSRPKDGGGLQLARFGGVLPSGQRVLPWRSFQEIEDLIATTPILMQEQRRPCCSFAGSDDLWYPLPVGAIDADYKPESDNEDRIGQAIMVALGSALINRGHPVFSSTSWNGFHAPFHLGSWPDGRLRRLIQSGKMFRAWPSKPGSKVFGVRIEVFPPSHRGLVALWKERAIANACPENVIPQTSYRDIFDLLEEAKEPLH